MSDVVLRLGITSAGPVVTGLFKNWRGRDRNNPSLDIAKDADQRF